MQPKKLDEQPAEASERYARWSLYANTVYMLGTAKSLLSPSLLASVGFGIVGSEFAQIVLVWQLWTLKNIYENHPQVLFGDGLGKACLAAQIFALSVTFKNLCQGVFKAPQELASALHRVGIQPTATTGKTPWNFFWRCLCLIPLFTVSRMGRTVNVQRNIRYAELEPQHLLRWQRTPHALRNLNMLSFRGRVSGWLCIDVYALEATAATGKEKRPVCVYFHGGGWLIGDKMGSGLGVINRLAARGVVVVAANYRLAPDVTLETQIKDCKRALIYVKKHCEQWGGDSAHVFVSGESAGGHLSALMGCTGNYAPLQPEEFPLEDTSVAGCLPIYGVFDMTDSDGHLSSIREHYMGVPIGVRSLVSVAVIQQVYREEIKHYWEEVSPTVHVRRMQHADQAPKTPFPPYFISHGTLDSLASHTDAEQFFTEVSKLHDKFPEFVAKPCFVSLSGGVHGYGYFPSPRGNSLGDAFSDFIHHHTYVRRRQVLRII